MNNILKQMKAKALLAGSFRVSLGSWAACLQSLISPSVNLFQKHGGSVQNCCSFVPVPLDGAWVQKDSFTRVKVDGTNPVGSSTMTRSSSREVRIRVPTFFCSLFE